MKVVKKGGRVVQFTMTIPDDWHLHVRDELCMASVIGDTVRRFGRAIIMPNLKPPVVTTADAIAYRERILRALPKGSTFELLMTLYLTDNTSPTEIARANKSGVVYAVKYYPAGATTNAENGVTDIRGCYPTIEMMQKLGMPLLVHGEVTDPGVDVFDREMVFLERTLYPLTDEFPGLRVVLEHVTTKEGVAFVREAGPNVAATITAHHLLLNRTDIFQGGLRPHNYCLPVAKREKHRLALVAAATSGSPKFFLGTDSAPHARETKEAACGCAGIFTAHAALELYAEVFEKSGALDKLEVFASINGPTFYGLPVNQKKITLVRESWTVPDKLPFGDSALVPFRAGEQVHWKIKN